MGTISRRLQLVVVATTLFLASVAGQPETAGREVDDASAGRLVVCLASKGQFDHGEPADQEGLRGLAALAHKYDFPVTYYLKPFAAEASKAELQSWHERFGDEVGWFSEGTSFKSAEAELDRLRQIVTWHSITATGNTKYGPSWVTLYQQRGITSVWGRCYEQTFVDGITDRGCPPGFYYARPDCFKVPNNAGGGVVTVPWLSNDLNLCFRTAWQPTFTFDPNDTQDIRVSTATDATFWEAELAEYQKQTRYNKVVPLVVQQELSEFNFSDSHRKKWRQEGAVILENLFKILKSRGIKVVTVSQAVERYKQAYPEKTPPTYAVFGNISHLPIIKNCDYFKLTTERFTTGTGPTINGYYACNRVGKTRNYYHPQGVSFYDQKRNLTYYDQSGLVIFEEGNATPIRITSYLDLPEDGYKATILPEMSYWFDTDRFIPKATVIEIKTAAGLQLKIEATAVHNPVIKGEQMPYGVMLWGDYSAWQVPADAPAGTKVLGSDGLIVPMLLKAGLNTLKLVLSAKNVKATVYELNVEKSRHDQLVAATAVQGLANRDGARVFLQTVDADWMVTFKHKDFVHAPDTLRKYRSVDDAWKEYYAAQHGLEFQTVDSLDALVSKVGDGIHGVILYDPHKTGELPVAVTLAGLRAAVPVTEAVRRECPALAALPVLEDLRGRFADRIAAHRWAVQELLPQCSQDGAFSYTGGIDAMSLDIAVARKMFVYQLAHLSSDVATNREQRAKFAKREGGLNPPDGPLVQTILAHLKPISPVWGWGGPNEETYLFTVSKGGAFVMCAQVPNISLHAQIKPAKAPLRQRHVKAEDVQVEPKHYVAFMVNEGDTMKCAGTMMMCGSWLEPERGRLPINWGISPYLCEQFPGMMEFYYSTMTANDYFFDGPGGYGYIAPRYLPKDVLMPFAERTRQGNVTADTRISDLWYFYPLQPDDLRNRWLAAMGLSGLTQWRGPQRVIYPPGCPPIIDSPHYYDKLTPEELAAQLISESKKSPRPCFTLVYAGDPHRFWEIGKRLPPEQFKIVRLDELFIAAAKSRHTGN